MVVIPINVCVPDDIHRDILSGKLRLQGLVKDNDNKVRRHLPTISQAVKNGAKKAVAVIKCHKTASIVVGTLLAIGAGAAITAACLSKRKKEAVITLFNENLEKYLSSLVDGTLSSCVIDDLIKSLDNLQDMGISINLSPAQLGAIVLCVYDYTLKLAQVNNRDIEPVGLKENAENIIDIRKYLLIQKDIFLSA